MEQTTMWVTVLSEANPWLGLINWKTQFELARWVDVSNEKAPVLYARNELSLLLIPEQPIKSWCNTLLELWLHLKKPQLTLLSYPMFQAELITNQIIDPDFIMMEKKFYE